MLDDDGWESGAGMEGGGLVFGCRATSHMECGGGGLGEWRLEVTENSPGTEAKPLRLKDGKHQTSTVNVQYYTKPHHSERALRNTTCFPPPPRT